MNNDTSELSASQISDYLDFNKNLANVEREINGIKGTRKSMVSHESGYLNKENEQNKQEVPQVRKLVMVE